MNNSSPPRAWATIDLAALQKNLAYVASLSDAKIVAVIKANGYGHGMVAIANAIKAAATQVECLAVATVDEALALKKIDSAMAVLLLPGFANAEECRILLAHGIETVVHTADQVATLHQELVALERQGESKASVRINRVWIKLDTGMHRLGLLPGECVAAFQQLSKSPGIGRLVLMTHLASADDIENPVTVAATDRQLAELDKVLVELHKAAVARPEVSVAASSALVNLPQSHHQYVRPGIMLYGGSAVKGLTGEQMGLQPVMTLRSRLIAIKTCLAGEKIGYGGSYSCETDVRMGVVSIGYGDGYPRCAGESAAPVLVKTASGSTRTRLIGRVSMDMLCIDLTEVPDAQLGDEVVLWGEGLSADEIAQHIGTISYELFCHAMPRVTKIYL